MNVVFLTYFPFPYGLAAVNRLISLAKGMIEEGHNLNVFCLLPTEISGNVKNHEITGVYSGINFEYVSKTCQLPSGRIKRYWLNLYSHLRSLFILYHLNKKKRIDVMIHPYPVSFFLFFSFCFLKHIKYQWFTKEPSFRILTKI